MGNDDGTEKDSYIRYVEVNKGDVDVTFDITKAEGPGQQGTHAEGLHDLPAGEYKIWFIYGPANSGRWWDYAQDGTNQNYNNPYINERTVTDPICIKIVDPADYDYSLEYKTWIGGSNKLQPMYSYIRLEKNVFKQGEPIQMSFKGRTEIMFAWLLDANNNELTSTWTEVVAKAGSGKLETWSSFYEVEGTSHLAPGKYKLYYAVYGSSPMSSIYNSGAIVTIMDIIVLPGEESVVSPLKLDVTYTNTAGKRVTKTYDVPLDVSLDASLKKIEKTAVLNDVKSNTTVEFMFYYESAYRQELTNVKATVQRVQQ